MCIRDRKYNGKITSNLDAVNPDIFVDEMHFTNVIFNLLDNAVKYKKQEGELVLNVRTWNEMCIRDSDSSVCSVICFPNCEFA